MDDPIVIPPSNPDEILLETSEDIIPPMDSSEIEINTISEEEVTPSKEDHVWVKRYFIHVETNGKPFQLIPEKNPRGAWVRFEDMHSRVRAYYNLLRRYRRLKKKAAAAGII